MGQLRIGRLAYWFMVAALIVLKFGGVMVMLSAPQTYGILHYLDTAVVFALALVVGARFADIGWPRWLGITLVLLITLVLPVVLIFAQRKLPAPTQNPLDLAPDLVWISTVLLTILLIVAGVKRSSSILDARNDGKRVGLDERKEPRFP